MGRKLIELGGGTLVVSLPRKFVKKNNLEKGEEIDIYTKENKLIISPDEVEEKQDYSVDIKEFKRTGGRYIVSSYRLGFDEIKIRFSDSDYIRKIPKTLAENTIGLEIIEQKDNFCRLKNLSETNKELLDKIIKRIWFMTIDFSKDILTHLRKNSYGELSKMYLREKNINKFTNYALRILSKNKSIEQKHAFPLYYFIRYFENISDDYENLASFYSEEKSINSEKIIDMLGSTNSLLKGLYDIFYDYDIKKIEELILESEVLYEKIKNEKSNSKGFLFLFNISKKIKRMCSVVIELNIFA
ncbi:AbrB/MazE/SpoVT family DNA-binding domain-containing protein [Candidatus Woesearchaeota archaeon]|nr:AbrB/MazE/SpoVT family DNA-binding domain-containing protein [Candidatus Woesearchaeota archaeon]